MILSAGWTRRLIPHLACLILTFGSSPFSPPGEGDARASGGYAPHVPGEILIKFRQSAGPWENANARAAVGGARLKRFRSGAEHWILGAGLGTEEAIARLRDDPAADYGEPNYLLHAHVPPNRP